MTDISLTKTIAVLSARPTDRAPALRALTRRIRAGGLKPVLGGPADDEGPAVAVPPTVDLLRRADWSTTFDTVVDACAHERDARLAATVADVLLLDGGALRALARYQAGLALRGDEFDASIRGWLEGPATGAAARYDAVLHIRAPRGADRAARLVDRELSGVLERVGIPPEVIFIAPSDSVLDHIIEAILVAAGLGTMSADSVGPRLTG